MLLIMKNNVKLIILFLVLIVTTFLGVFYYVYNTDARDLKSEDAKFTINSTKIIAEFVGNIDQANQKYLDKPVVIIGKVTSISGANVILDQSINCVLEKNDPSIKENMTIQVKGRVIGYDDLLSELKIDMCNQIK
jgi:hypothetical protein